MTLRVSALGDPTRRIGLGDQKWLGRQRRSRTSGPNQSLERTCSVAAPVDDASGRPRTNLWIDLLGTCLGLPPPNPEGSVLGTEMRALNNIGARRISTTSGMLVPLTAFGPNINIARDPRFGRNSELPGEDPVLSGTYAYEMVSGMQERDAHGFPKVAAFLKHFTAYSSEADRGHDNYAISAHDMFDTYLPQYERAVRAGPAGVMCSYAGTNGQPSCSNGWLLNRILRGWAPNAVVTTDCGAVGLLTGLPVKAPDEVHAAAFALMNGTDLEMGYHAFKNLPLAIQQGLATEARVDEAARRLFRTLFLVGRFDPGASEWTRLGRQDINSTRHQQACTLGGQIWLASSRALRTWGRRGWSSRPVPQVLFAFSEGSLRCR